MSKINVSINIEEVGNSLSCIGSKLTEDYDLQKRAKILSSITKTFMYIDRMYISRCSKIV